MTSSDHEPTMGGHAGQSGLALPGILSQPAQRALANAGYARLEQLTGVSEAEIGRLHGIGPKGLKMLRQALADHGLSFAAEQRKGG